MGCVSCLVVVVPWFVTYWLVVMHQAGKDGLSLMLKDLCLTVQTSATNMFAGRLGLGQQYQLSIFANTQNTFGFSPSGAGGNPFALMIGYSIRLVGSRLLGMVGGCVAVAVVVVVAVCTV